MKGELKMEMTLDRPAVSYGNNGFPKSILFGILIVMVVVGVISHAVLKHKDDAALSLDCFENNPRLKITVVKPDNENRRVELCLIEDKYMAIRVSEKINGKFEELTRYIDRSYKTVDKMIDYAEVEMGKYGWMDYISDAVKPFLVIH